MLYGTLKYHEPPIRLAKYEIDSHIFMHQVQGKPNIDANLRKWKNGCKGGRPVTKIKPNNNQE